MNNKISSRGALSAIALAALCLPHLLMAADPVGTTPVGYNEVVALGDSDTRFSVPLHRAAVFLGTVKLLGGTGGSSLTVEGAPAWGANTFAYAAGSQANTYYVSLATGAKAGMYYTITANSADTLTLDLAGDTLNGTGGVQPGNELAIIPYWTLTTLFPGQQGITGTTSAGGSGAATKILFANNSTAGINLSPSTGYFYYTGAGGTGPSWRRAGSGATRLDDEVLYPDSYIVIRQDGIGTSTLLSATGTVALGERKYVLGTLAPDTAQDNAIAIEVAVPMTLAQSRLFESGAFEGTSSAGGAGGGDRLLAFDDLAAAYNKSPSAIYFYYTGTGGGGPSWRRSGTGVTNMNTEPVFQPGKGYVIRKAAKPQAGTQIWALTPPYAD